MLAPAFGLLARPLAVVLGAILSGLTATAAPAFRPELQVRRGAWTVVTVDRLPFMGDFSAGLVLAWPAFQVTYTQVLRMRELRGQDEPDVFGSIAVTFFR